MSVGCHSPRVHSVLLGRTWVDLGDYVPAAGGRRQEAYGMSVRQIAGGLTCIKLIRVHPELSTAVGTGGETGEAERI